MFRWTDIGSRTHRIADVKDIESGLTKVIGEGPITLEGGNIAASNIAMLHALPDDGVNGLEGFGTNHI